MELIFLSLGWLVGLWLGQTAGWGADPSALLAQTAPYLACLVALSAVAALLGRQESSLRVGALAVGMGLLGIWRAFSLVPEVASSPPVGDSVVAVGTISARPEPRDATLQLVLDVTRWQQPVLPGAARARVLVRTDRYQEWNYGDRVVARGPLRAVDPASGYWAEYLARQGIYAEMPYPQLQLLERSRGSDPGRLLDLVRSRLEEVCARLLPEPQASLLAGILVGTRATMPAEFRAALNATGTSHIVAVSGFNVMVVAGTVLAAGLRILSRRKATLLALLAVWAYSMLTGLPPSALRAAVMATMALSATLVGRGGDTLSFLCFSAAVMAGFDPLLLYDLGFQLSFLATAGLVLLEPVLRGWLGRLPGFLASSFSVTLAAQLTTLPVLMANFHTLSLVSPLSNLLIAPVLPALMGFGALAVGLGALLEPLGQMVTPLAWLYLTYLVETIRWTGQFSWAGVPTGDLGLPLVLLYYAVLLGMALWPLPELRPLREAAAGAGRRLPIWAMAGTAVACLCLLASAFLGRPDGMVHVYFLEVGDGDATLIRGPEGHTVLVDGGPSPTAVTGTLGRRLGLLDRGLDLVVVSGFDERRLSGLMEVVRRHPVGLVWQPEPPANGRAASAWLELLEERGVDVVTASTGQRVELGKDVCLDVVWAPGGSSEELGSALALRLTAYGTEVILPGDLTRAAQAEIARGKPGRIDLLRVPRQGATGALEQSFLQAMSPQVAVVSVRAGDGLDYPAESTLEMLRGTTLFRTDLHGTVELAIGPDGYQIFTDR